MPPNEGAASIDVAAQSFAYDVGAAGAPIVRAIAVEAAVQIVIGGSPFAIMMATPQDLEDFGYGFCLTEGIAETPADIRGLGVERSADGWRVAIALTGERLKAHLARKRAMSGRTGCGLCGIEDFSQMPAPKLRNPRTRPVDPAAVGAALAELENRQPLNKLTRAVHAAAWCGRDGRIALVREDVGRHNALDKAIGALWRAGVDPDSGFFIITSRCSFEMVAKAAIFGATTLVAVSAPTSLALERAREFGLTVLAVARGDKALSFNGADAPTGGLAGVTSDKVAKLVRMANQIGDFYAAMPEKEAVEGAASHLRLYWTPKMIRELIAFVDADVAGLNATAAKAVHSLKQAAET